MQNKYSPYFGTIIYLKIPNFIPIPSNWKHDKLNVCPVYKKGDKYEHMLSLAASCNILKNILYDFQHGFRLSNSCETQLISFIHDLAQSADNNIQTDIIIMDFAKGFDKPSKHAYMGPIWATHKGPIWATHMGPIWGVQPGSAWVPYGLAHMRVAQMGPI